MVVAALVGAPIWAAVLGAGLVFGYWAIEVLVWRRARDRKDLALGAALGGSGMRLALVLAALVLVGVFARPAFATAALSFLAAFTVYGAVRLMLYTPPKKPAGGVEAR